MGYPVEVDEGILTFAVRYALGRMTYSVEMVRDAITDNAEKMSSVELGIIGRDIGRAFKDGSIGIGEAMVWQESQQIVAREIHKRDQAVSDVLVKKMGHVPFCEVCGEPQYECSGELTCKNGHKGGGYVY